MKEFLKKTVSLEHPARSDRKGYTDPAAERTADEEFLEELAILEEHDVVTRKETPDGKVTFRNKKGQIVLYEDYAALKECAEALARVEEMSRPFSGEEIRRGS